MNKPTQTPTSGTPTSARRGALSGIRVLDLTRLAPGPYCSMLLGDMGADVIAVGGGTGSLPISSLTRGKRFINLDLKSVEGRKAFHRLVETSDVVIEGYRPGVTERLGIDYKTLRGLNPRIVYCSLTGYGQSGPMALEAGHDLNYIAIAGALGAFGPVDGPPAFPLNILGDFAGGSLFAALGIVLALYARNTTGEGQYVDAAMVDGCLSLMTMHFVDWGNPVLLGRGDGLVAGNAPFYRCYRCSDGGFIAIGALERRFFENAWKTFGYPDPIPNHMDRSIWPSLTERFEKTFALRTRDEWTKLFEGKDACVTAVLDPIEALTHPQNKLRHPDLNAGNPVVAPVLSGTPGSAAAIDLTDQTFEVLRSVGLSEEDAKKAVIPASEASSGMKWPPL